MRYLSYDIDDVPDHYRGGSGWWTFLQVICITAGNVAILVGIFALIDHWG